MSKAYYLSFTTGEPCEICQEQDVMVLIREQGIEAGCCEDCVDVATEKLEDSVIMQFGY